MTSHETFTPAMQTYQSREEPERLYAIAGIYWRTLLLIGIVLFIIATAGGAYLLTTILFGLNDGKPQQASMQTLNRAQLTKTIQAYEARKTLFDALGEERGVLPDPTR